MSRNRIKIERAVTSGKNRHDYNKLSDNRSRFASNEYASYGKNHNDVMNGKILNKKDSLQYTWFNNKVRSFEANNIWTDPDRAKSIRNEERGSRHNHKKSLMEDLNSRPASKSSNDNKMSIGAKIGLGVAGTGAAIYGAHRLRKYLKNKKEQEIQKSASLFSGETSHEVNLGKDTRDWVDSKIKNISSKANGAKDYAKGLSDKAKPYATRRNAAIGAASVGALVGARSLKNYVKGKLEDRSARKKEDDRINYYKDQMDRHKDNQYMLRALTSRMSKEKFDA